jgi:hypothetical protein
MKMNGDIMRQSGVGGNLGRGGATAKPSFFLKTRFLLAQGSRGERGQGVPRSPQEEAILAIRVVDPACGSGHFLIAAARRLARHGVDLVGAPVDRGDAALLARG